MVKVKNKQTKNKTHPTKPLQNISQEMFALEEGMENWGEREMTQTKKGIDINNKRK